MAHPASSQVSPQVKEITRLLGSGLATWRNEARARLREMDDSVEILTVVLRQFEINRAGFIIRFSSLMLTMMIFQLLKSASTWLVVGGNFVISFLVTLGAAATMALLTTAYLSIFCFPSARRIRKYGTLLLTREYSDDIRAVGPLAEGLEIKDTETRKEVLAALTKLLPRLTEADSSLLDAKQRLCLYRALSRKESAFLQSLLHAIEMVGDANGISYVQKLAYDPTNEAHIEVAAQRCWKVLWERRERARATETLLRPAEREAISSETLLRPVTATVNPSEPEILLRAYSTGEAIQ